MSEEQKQAYQETLQRGEAFEALIRSKGWEYVKSYYLNTVQQFATSLLLEDTKKIEEFEDERRELIGLRKLMGRIENDIKVLENEREKTRNTKTPKK